MAVIGGTHRFLVLDGLRGVAALMVLIGHTSDYARMSTAAVDLFFLLSGFVLAHAFAERLQQPGGGRRFLIERVIRLAPLYVIGTAVGGLMMGGLGAFGIWWWEPKSFLPALIAAPFLLPVPFQELYPFNPSVWSLFFELVANVALVRLGSTRRIAALTALICGLALAVTIALWVDDPTTYGSKLIQGSARVGFSFFLGVLMYRLWQSNSLPRVNIPAPLLIALPLLLYGLDIGHHKLYFFALVFIVQPVLVCVAVHSVPTGSWSKLAAWLGLISYGVYVLHYPIVILVELLLRLLDGHVVASTGTHPATVFVVGVLAVGAAHWLTLKVDAPARAWLRRRFIARHPTGMAEQTTASQRSQ